MDMVKKGLLFLNAFEKNVDKNPNQMALKYIEPSLENKTLTYENLMIKSKAIAAYLQQVTQLGDRVFLSYEPGLDFVTAFLGCLYAGVIAVPAYPLRRNYHAKRFLLMLEDCNPRFICGTHESLKQLEKQEELAFYQTIYTEEINESISKTYTPTLIKPGTLAFLQYTSGSTSSPKGVLISHDNIQNNLQAIHYYFQLTAKDIRVSWLPMQHDMGLIGDLIYALYVGMAELVMSPTHFLANPFFWLKSISDYQASTSGSPNFGYELCIEKVTEEQLDLLDLSCWKIAYNGSEPIRNHTLEAFANKFKRCGFKKEAFLPCYGMAETTLLVSGKPHQTTYTTQCFGKTIAVSSGQVYKNYQLKIANPNTFQECEEGEVGEIWVNGPSVAEGYWNKKKETHETFKTILPADKKNYLRTGDLGFLKKKELFITGRLKDLIILQGRVIYPQDVEHAVESSHFAIRQGCTAAFSVEVNHQEQLVVVAEVKRMYRKIDFESVFQAIRAAVRDHIEATPYSIQLLAPAQVLKTTSGKIQRKAIRTAYIEKKLNLLAQDNLLTQMQEVPTKKELENILTYILKKVLAVKFLDRNARYSELGGTSLQAVYFQQQIQHYLGNKMQVPASIIFDYPTIAQLVDYIHAHLTRKITKPRYDNQKSVIKEPIAIIGMACRFPGGANNLEQFWDNLFYGRDAIGEVPPTRFDINAYYDANPQNTKKIHTKEFGFIEGMEEFDAAFFSISPREALFMDPQQRLLLETTWHALEDAGIDPRTLKGRRVGVFVGIQASEYTQLLRAQAKEYSFGMYHATGNALSVASGRIAYILGTQGPALSIDTACSSSLVALHEAVRALYSGDCDLALVAGVNSIIDPNTLVALSNAQMLSPDGRCKTFDVHADGYGRAEGCGVIILQSIGQAKANGSRIQAILKSSCVNQDGPSSGLTVPNGVAQASLLEQSLQAAGLNPEEIDYIECHGTGTSLGDPIEMEAISKVYGGRKGYPLIIGTVKTNIGHLESASGVAGLIKTILAMQHQYISKQLHFHTLNPNIHLEAIPAQIPLEGIKWHSRGDKPRRAGVSSFGFSGTNAHVILEEAPKTLDQNKTIELPQEALLILSAKSKRSLNDLIQAYRDYLKKSDNSLANICYTAAIGRAHFNYRIGFLARSKEELLDQMQGTECSIQENPLSDEVFVSSNLEQLHAAYLQGKCIDWNAYYAPYRKALCFVALPIYPFDRQRYWLDTQTHQEEQAEFFYRESWEPLQFDLIHAYPTAYKLCGDIPKHLTLAQDENAEITLFFVPEDQALTHVLTYVNSLLQDDVNTGTVHVFITQRQAFIPHSKDIVSLRQAGIIGFIKSVLVEEPTLRCRLLDISSLDDLPYALIALANTTTSFLAIRNHQAYELLLRSESQSGRKKEQGKNKSSTSEVIFRANSSYVITGGLGSLGLVLCKWLSAHGATHIVLLARRVMDEAIQQRLNALSAKVSLYQLELTDHQALQKILKNVNKTHPIRGLFHLAGKLDDVLLRDQTPERLHYVWAPKAGVAWSLHQLTIDLKLNEQLDYFVLFSSIASSIGSPGQSNYAAANSYLDALAIYRYQHHLKALSINWSAWAQIGMAVKFNQANSDRGINALSTRQALNLLAQALLLKDPVIQAADIDWNRFSQQGIQLSWLKPLLMQQQEGELALLLKSSSQKEWAKILQEHLESQLRAILNLPDNDLINPEQSFFELGMDSLMAVEFKNRIQQLFGSTFLLSSTLAFDYRSINLLRDYLLENLQPKIEKKLKEPPLTSNTTLQHINKKQRITTLSDTQLQWWILGRVKLKEKLFHFRIDLSYLVDTDLLNQALNEFYTFFPDTLFCVSRYIAIALIGKKGNTVTERVINTKIKYSQQEIQEIIYRQNKRNQKEINFFMQPIKILNIRCQDKSVIYITLNHYIIDYAIMKNMLLNLIKLIDAAHEKYVYIPQLEEMRFSEYLALENETYLKSTDFFKKKHLKDYSFHIRDYYVPRQSQSKLCLQNEKITKNERDNLIHYIIRNKYSFLTTLVACCILATKEVFQLPTFFGTVVTHQRNDQKKLNTFGLLAAHYPLCIKLNKEKSFQDLHHEIFPLLKENQEEPQLMAFAKITLPWIRKNKKRTFFLKWLMLMAALPLRVLGYSPLKIKCLVTWAYIMSFFNPKLHRKKINDTYMTPIFFTVNVFDSFIRDDMNQFKDNFNYPIQYIEQDDLNYIGLFIFFLQTFDGDYELCIRSPLSEELTSKIKEAILIKIKGLRLDEIK